MRNDIYYIVNLDLDRNEEIYPSIKDTTIRKSFCGKIVNESHGKLFFELNGSGALVIIPYSWIKFMAPSKVLWDKRKEENDG